MDTRGLIFTRVPIAIIYRRSEERENVYARSAIKTFEARTVARLIGLVNSRLVPLSRLVTTNSRRDKKKKTRISADRPNELPVSRLSLPRRI